MVNFTKQFEDQRVPEWKEAFVDYSQLKKDLKRIHLININDETRKKNGNTIKSSLQKLTLFGNKRRDYHNAIEVHRKVTCSESNGCVYETELVENFVDSEAAKEFFIRLDSQLNKVNQFYKTKEKELLERGECLKIQLEILMTVKTSSSQGFKEDESISCTISCEEDEVNVQEQCEEQKLELPRFEEIEKGINLKQKTMSGRILSCKGKNFKIKIPMTNPSRAISAISYLIKDDLVNQSSKKCGLDGNKLHINKKNLHHAEKMIKKALIELHKGLNYLKTYRNLNMLAFMKILKKFDKVTKKQILPIYLNVVETSYFNSSDKVINLSDEVEELFIKHFANENRRKAMRYLKPHQRKESHGVTFFIGLFTGCFFALLAGYITTASFTGMYKQHSNNTLYMETAYPVISMFGLGFLHLFLYGCNIFVWRKTRINYSFIFELNPTEEIKYRDVFLICSVCMTVVFGVMFIHLSILTKGYSFRQVQVIPGLLLLLFLILLVCPLNIFYKSSRYRFVSIIRNIVLSPLYKVAMLDFFMADQFCSQVPMLRNLEYIACYYITGSYKTQDYGYCMRANYYKDLAYAVSFLPYYWRAMQCARRWFDEGETSHLVNLGKYVSAMLAAGAKVAYEKEKSVGWLSLVVVMSSAATMYQLYWDFVKDWGLLQVNCKNPWLRNELMLRPKFIYYFSMILNFVLRLAWLQTVLHSNFEHVDYRITGLFLAALEVIRRGLWNFFRLENEHLNNAGKFRAVKIVPLPFREVDEED